MNLHVLLSKKKQSPKNIGKRTLPLMATRNPAKLTSWGEGSWNLIIFPICVASNRWWVYRISACHQLYIILSPNFGDRSQTPWLPRKSTNGKPPIYNISCVQTQQKKIRTVERTKKNPCNSEKPRVDLKHTNTPWTNFDIWVFPKIGVPQNGCFFWKTLLKWDDLGLQLIFRISISVDFSVNLPLICQGAFLVSKLLCNFSTHPFYHCWVSFCPPNLKK